MNDELKNSLIKFIIIKSLFIIFFSSCTVQQQIAKSANREVLDAVPLQTAHIGISIYEPATGKYWYDYQGDKYFTPASNTKIATCYAAMKYLGDSLVGLRYGIPEEKRFKENLVVIYPSGDPTFLCPEYIKQSSIDFLKQIFFIEHKKAGFFYDGSKVVKWGSGWSWDDYEEPYMTERNVFPISGNVVSVRLLDVKDRFIGDTSLPYEMKFRLFQTGSKYFDSLVNKNLQRVWRSKRKEEVPNVNLSRDIVSNSFIAEMGEKPFVTKTIPFVTNETSTVINILSDTLKTQFTYVFKADNRNRYEWANENGDLTIITINKWQKIHSQPTDSVLKPMMHRSDNFFAEQTLLMVSNERLGIMNDEKIIDTLLKTDFKDLPQKSRWVDGSGLSRYNLFTPKDLVFILNKMKNEFGMERVKAVFPTGGQGTLTNYYIADSNFIYAKTGTLSGVVALSGYLYTKKGKEFIFSVLVNNHQASGTEVRRAVEKFLQGVRNKY